MKIRRWGRIVDKKDLHPKPKIFFLIFSHLERSEPYLKEKVVKYLNTLGYNNLYMHTPIIL